MASAPQKQRFGNLDIDEIKQKQQDLRNSNSVKNEKKSSEAFKAYLEQIKVENTDFFTYSEPELDGHLATFWWNARTRSGEKYKASSLETIRHGLKRALINYGHQFDITDEKGTTSFTKSIKAFKAAIKELKLTGFGHVTHRKEIIPEGQYLFLIVSKHTQAT